MFSLKILPAIESEGESPATSPWFHQPDQVPNQEVPPESLDCPKQKMPQLYWQLMNLPNSTKSRLETSLEGEVVGPGSTPQFAVQSSGRNSQMASRIGLL
jgi:hypothetical protein